MHTIMKKCRYGVAMGVVALCFTALSPPAAAGYTLTKINPCSTGSGIDCESFANRRHWVYAPDTADNRLAVFFPGTLGSANNLEKVAQELVNVGMHVIVMSYKNGTGTHGLCDGERLSDPNCFRKYRSEVVFGVNVADPDGNAYASNKVDVSKQNSAMNRLLQLVNYLKNNYASQGWAQFQSAVWNSTYSQYNPTWSTLTTGGHSQGGGVALYFGKFYALDGVAMLSSPQDGWNESGTIYSPNWINEGGFDVTLSSVFGFDHETEEFNMTAIQTNNWTDLGLPGSIVDTDVNSPPYNSSRLQTSAVPACTSFTKYHGSTATDDCTPGSPPTHKPVWLYMFGN